MNGFTCVLVEFLEIRQAQPANIELTQRSLANGEAGNAQVIAACAAAIQEASRFEVHQKTVNRADGQSRKLGNLRCGETPLGAGKDRKSTRLNSSHLVISYAVFC